MELLLGILLLIVIFTLVFPEWVLLLTDWTLSEENQPSTADEGNAGAGQSSKTFEDLVGTMGIAATSLTPSGKVRIAGTTYPARSNAEFIEKGAAVRTVSADAFGIVVETHSEISVSSASGS